MPIDHEHKTARLGSRSPGLSPRTSFDTQPAPNTYEHSQATMTWQLLHPHSCSDGISSRSYLIRASPALSAPMSLDHSPLHPAVPPPGVRQYAADRSWVARPGKINRMTRRSTCSWAYSPQPNESIYGRLSPYVLCSTAYPCRIRNGKRHAAMPDTRRGHKGASKSA